MTTPTFLKLKTINEKCLKYQTKVVVAVDYHLNAMSSKPQACMLVRGFGLVVKHLTADPGIASSIPPHSN